MENLATRIKQSTDRILGHGAEFLQTTGRAGEEFVSRTRTAGTTFLGETRDAGVSFLNATRGASNLLAEGTLAEAKELGELVRAEAPSLPGREEIAAIAPREVAEAAAEAAADAAKKVPSVAEVEKRVLTGLNGALEGIESKVQERLDAIEDDAAEVAVVAPAAPWRGYEKMTAREIIAKLGNAKADKAAAVAAFETANKGRSTVLKAAKARVA